MARSYDSEFRVERARRLEKARLNKGWTRTQLAAAAGYDEKTIRNVLEGLKPVKDETIIDISEALGVAPELVNTREEVDVSDDEYGGYSRSTHRMYEGYYYLFRPSFSRSEAIFKGVVFIKWDSEADLFIFNEYYDFDDSAESGVKSHTGPVCMSSYTNLVHLMTMYEGSVRLLTLTKMRETDWMMRGAMQTQSENINFFQPTFSPVIMRKCRAYDPAASLKSDIGLITEGHADYAFAREQLGFTERLVLKIVLVGETTA